MERTGEVSDKLDKPGKHQLDFLGLRVEQLKGRVLELGSGKSEKLKDTPGLLDDCEIISLSKNIFQGRKPFIETLKKKPEWDKKTVEADVSALPFEDQSFNWVLSVDAIPLFLTSRKKIERAFKEVWRILKPGGEARFFTANQSDLELARRLFANLGVQIELQPLDTEVVDQYARVDKNTRRLVIKKPR